MMWEIKNQYLPSWDTGHRWPVWPEVTKFYNDTRTDRRNGATEAMSTPVVPEIERVIFNGPATIVKCMEGEEFDEEKGIAMAFMKKLYGTGYMRKIRRHIPVKLSVEEVENANKR